MITLRDFDVEYPFWLVYRMMGYREVKIKGFNTTYSMDDFIESDPDIIIIQKMAII